MKTKLTALLLTVIMLFTLAISASARSYDEDLAASITANYKTALSLAGRRTFYGKCNLATAYQLRAWGIFKDGLDYAGTGSSWYQHYKTEKKTSGGYNIITIGGANCLYDLVDKYGNEIYNVAYCLGTGGTSGGTHVLFIRAIIDGNVYFTDSFNMTYGQSYYPEGRCTVRTLSEFISAYKKMNGNAYGCVYFTKDDSEHLSGSSQTPDKWQDQNRTFSTGDYTVTASLLRIRDGASTDDASLGLVPNGTTVSVTKIKDNWGLITWEGITGWICLDYTLQISCDDDIKNNIVSMILKADKSVAFCGEKITWTVDVSGDSASKYFYAFYIFRNGEKVYNGTFSSQNTVSYVPDAEGTYQASVEIVDSENKKTTLRSECISCLEHKTDAVHGDANGDGKVTASDARLVLRVAAMMETLTGKNFVCADVDKDNKLSASDARKILRIASGLERDIEE